jgi:acyl-CoA synthetase (AMP-forming)/AMP-acid ligase II
MNIALLLQMAADTQGDRIGLVCDGREWTYTTLLTAAHGAADLVNESQCEYVTLLDESSEAAFIGLFGAALAGVPYVPLNYRLADEDLGALLDRVENGLVIGDIERTKRITAHNQTLLLTRADFVDTAVLRGATTQVEESQAEVAAQIFTSGTTAAPKAALLKHSNLLGYILGSVEFMSADEQDAILVCVPPYHIAGISALLSSCYAMRRIVMLPAFDPKTWLDLVAHEKVSNAFVVPTMLSRIIEAIEAGHSGDLSSLRALAYGGGKMPLELIKKALALFPSVNFTNAYGLTETSSTVALLTPEDHREAIRSEDPKVSARLASVGKALPSVEIEIRDDEGNRLSAGERGEIYIRGEQVSGTYKEKSSLTADGWFPTRDAGYMDEEGYLFLDGRADDVIVRGGENLSPGEIEDVLLTHDAIADAAVVAIPSAEWGEAPAAAIVMKSDVAPPSPEEVCAFIKQRLRSSRVPERVITVSELPYNDMGKLLRRVVKTYF